MLQQPTTNMLISNEEEPNSNTAGKPTPAFGLEQESRMENDHVFIEMPTEIKQIKDGNDDFMMDGNEDIRLEKKVVYQKSKNNQEHAPIVHQHITQSDVVLFNSPKVVLEKMKADGIRKSKLTVDQLIILSLFAGLFKGLACAMGVLIGGNVPKMEEENPGLQKFFAGALFPVGLVLIVITGSELFTGNVMVLLVGLFSRKWKAKKFFLQYAQFSKNLFVSYIFNCLGAFIFAYFFIYLPQPCCTAHWITYVQKMAIGKVQKTFGNLMLLSIICNMLVTIAIFNANAATSLGGKIIGIWFPIMSFVSLGFEHSIANAFYIPLGMLYGADITVYDFLIGNLLPVTIGNILGGAIVNACLIYYVHDFRVRHNRTIFNLAENVWKQIKNRGGKKDMPLNDSSNSSIELGSSIHLELKRQEAANLK